MKDLIVRLRIEEDNKLAQKRSYVPASAKANMVEHGQSSRGVGNKFVIGKEIRGEGYKLGPKGGKSWKKFQGKCYNCDVINQVTTLQTVSCQSEINQTKQTWSITSPFLWR